MHGTLLQHGDVSEHCWPYAPHGGVVGGGVLASVPEGGGGGVVVEPPHEPTSEPGGTLHAMPEQQSAVVVQLPPEGTHAPPQTSLPLASGVQGRPQQSALDAHALPVCADGFVQSTGAIRQRGMPRLSCLQTGSWRALPEQQVALALQLFSIRRQIWPAAWHLLPLSHRPNWLAGSLRHFTSD